MNKPMNELVEFRKTREYRDIRDRHISITRPGADWYELVRSLKRLCEESKSYPEIEQFVRHISTIESQFRQPEA